MIKSKKKAKTIGSEIDRTEQALEKAKAAWTKVKTECPACNKEARKDASKAFELARLAYVNACKPLRDLKQTLPPELSVNEQKARVRVVELDRDLKDAALVLKNATFIHEKPGRRDKDEIAEELKQAELRYKKVKKELTQAKKAHTRAKNIYDRAVDRLKDTPA